MRARSTQKQEGVGGGGKEERKGHTIIAGFMRKHTQMDLRGKAGGVRGRQGMA